MIVYMFIIVCSFYILKNKKLIEVKLYKIVKSLPLKYEFDIFPSI